MTKTSLVDAATTKTTKDSSSSDDEINPSVEKDKRNEIIQQTETTPSTSTLSSITLPQQNKTVDSNTELVEQSELVIKSDSKDDRTGLKNTAKESLTTAKLVDKKTELTNDSSRIDDENDTSKGTKKLNETVEKENLTNTTSSYSQVKTTKEINVSENNTNNSSKIEENKSINSTPSLSSNRVSYKEETNNFNAQLADQKNSTNKDDSKDDTADLKNTTEKSLTTTRLADTNEDLTKKLSSSDTKIVGSEEIDKLNKTVQETDESIIPAKSSFNAKAASYNKDLSAAKDNIKSFSNSLSDDEDEVGYESIEYDTSKDRQKVEEIVLLGKIEKNAPLKTGTVDVSAMMIKGNGNYVETGRASKTHAIRINFKMFKNGNVSPGNKEVFIVILNPKKKVINQKGKFTLRSGKEMFYSDETMAYYDGHNINISILSGKFIQKIVKGTYIVQVYIERYLTGQTLLILS